MTAPDFLCIGCQRSGTTTLYNVLETHSEVWLPPIKEIHFFDEPPYSMEKRVTSLERRKLRFYASIEKGLDSSKISASNDFLKAYQHIVHYESFDMNDYFSLFSGKGSFKTGDITPAFSGASSALIERLSKTMPEVKVVLLVRNPIDRLWSHANKAMRDNKSKVTTDIDLFKRFCRKSSVTSRSFPSQIYLRWKEFFGDRISFFFFDTLRDNPRRFFDDVCSFIEVSPALLDLPDSGSINKEAKRRKRTAKDEFSSHMREIMEEEINRCAEIFRGDAIAWRSALHNA